jgi:Transposase DDE domain
MKQQYRVRNWSEYNLALKQRGSLTFWVSEDVIDQWLNIKQTETFGRAPTYSDVAILTMLSLKSLFGLAGRQTSGLMASLFDLMQVKLSVPDHPSTGSGTTARLLGG